MIFVEDWCTAKNIGADFLGTDKRTVTIDRRVPYFVENLTTQDDFVVDDDSKPCYNTGSEMKY